MSNLSIDRQLPAYVPGAGSTALTPSRTGGVNFAQSLAQVQATPPNWLTGADAARAARPNVREFMDQSGADFETASELLYGVVGSNTDVRDWKSIMASADPISAARAATGQMYNQESVGHAPDAVFASDTNTLARSGNFALIQTHDSQGNVDYQGLNLIAKNGLLLRDAGSRPETIARNAWLFGFDIRSLAALKTPAAAALAPSLANAIDGAGVASLTHPSASQLTSQSPIATGPSVAPLEPAAVMASVANTAEPLSKATEANLPEPHDVGIALKPLLGSDFLDAFSEASSHDPYALTQLMTTTLGLSAQNMSPIDSLAYLSFR